MSGIPKPWSQYVVYGTQKPPDRTQVVACVIVFTEFGQFVYNFLLGFIWSGGCSA